MTLVKLPTIDRNKQPWSTGPIVHINPSAVIAIEQMPVYGIAGKLASEIYLSNGTSIAVMVSPELAGDIIINAALLAKLPCENPNDIFDYLNDLVAKVNAESETIHHCVRVVGG